MSNETGPGLDRQSTVRTTARVVAVVLLMAGLFLVLKGGSAFVAGFDDPMASDGPGPILTLAAGGFCLVLGLAAANVGWLRTQASYVAGETMPVVKESATYLTDGRGVAGIGRTEEAAAATGPYCRQCGTRNDGDARFCDSCGHPLA
jgi:hypothetical protein